MATALTLRYLSGAPNLTGLEKMQIPGRKTFSNSSLPHSVMKLTVMAGKVRVVEKVKNQTSRVYEVAGMIVFKKCERR